MRMMSDQKREIDTEKLGKRKNQRSFLKPKLQPGGEKLTARSPKQHRGDSTGKGVSLKTSGEAITSKDKHLRKPVGVS